MLCYLLACLLVEYKVLQRKASDSELTREECVRLCWHVSVDVVHVCFLTSEKQYHSIALAIATAGVAVFVVVAVVVVVVVVRRLQTQEQSIN